MRLILHRWLTLNVILHKAWPDVKHRSALFRTPISVLVNFTFSSKWLQNWTWLEISMPTNPILLDKWRGLHWNYNAMAKGSLFAVNAQTCIFVGLNWNKLSRPHSEIHTRVSSTSDTSSNRLFCTMFQRTFYWLVYRARILSINN